MLAKFFLFVISLFGVTSITVLSPAPNVISLPKTNLSPVEKVVSNNQINNEYKKVDFSPLKSATSTPKSVAKTATKVVSTKTPPKSSDKQIEKENLPTEKVTDVSSVASSSLLSTSNSQLPTSFVAPVNFEKINENSRKALVNIICTSASGGYFEALSGSGIVIDSRGIILTNAHIAQYFLIKNSQGGNLLKCVARIGSPAVTAYNLSILHISPSWVKANYKSLRSQHPLGTGENDFALLRITGVTNQGSLPESFPYIQPDFSESQINTGKQILIAGYPAGFLGGIAIQRELYAVTSIINIGKLYTFRTGTLDAFSLGGSPVAQRGSSGGGAVGPDGKLLGIIVTSTDASDTASRDLDAISISHIDRSLFAEAGQSLDTLLHNNLDTVAENFARDILPELSKLLNDEFNSKTASTN